MSINSFSPGRRVLYKSGSNSASEKHRISGSREHQRHSHDTQECHLSDRQERQRANTHFFNDEYDSSSFDHHSHHDVVVGDDGGYTGKPEEEMLPTILKEEHHNDDEQSRSYSPSSRSMTDLDIQNYSNTTDEEDEEDPVPPIDFTRSRRIDTDSSLDEWNGNSTTTPGTIIPRYHQHSHPHRVQASKDHGLGSFRDPYRKCLAPIFREQNDVDFLERHESVVDFTILKPYFPDAQIGRTTFCRILTFRPPVCASPSYAGLSETALALQWCDDLPVTLEAFKVHKDTVIALEFFTNPGSNDFSGRSALYVNATCEGRIWIPSYWFELVATRQLNIPDTHPLRRAFVDCFSDSLTLEYPLDLSQSEDPPPLLRVEDDAEKHFLKSLLLIECRHPKNLCPAARITIAAVPTPSAQLQHRLTTPRDLTTSSERRADCDYSNNGVPETSEPSSCHYGQQQSQRPHHPPLVPRLKRLPLPLYTERQTQSTRDSSGRRREDVNFLSTRRSNAPNGIQLGEVHQASMGNTDRRCEYQNHYTIAPSVKQRGSPCTTHPSVDRREVSTGYRRESESTPTRSGSRFLCRCFKHAVPTPRSVHPLPSPPSFGHTTTSSLVVVPMDLGQRNHHDRHHHEYPLCRCHDPVLCCHDSSALKKNPMREACSKQRRSTVAHLENNKQGAALRGRQRKSSPSTPLSLTSPPDHARLTFHDKIVQTALSTPRRLDTGQTHSSTDFALKPITMRSTNGPIIHRVPSRCTACNRPLHPHRRFRVKHLSKKHRSTPLSSVMFSTSSRIASSRLSTTSSTIASSIYEQECGVLAKREQQDQEHRSQRPHQLSRSPLLTHHPSDISHESSRPLPPGPPQPPRLLRFLLRIPCLVTRVHKVLLRLDLLGLYQRLCPRY